MCNEAICDNPAELFLIPDRFKTEEMCKEAAEVDPWQLKDVPDHFKTQEMRDGPVRDYLFSVQFVPDTFVTQQQVDAWHDDHYVYNDNEMTKWYNRYKKRNVQKAKTKEELLLIAWHPNCVMSCMSVVEKGLWK